VTTNKIDLGLYALGAIIGDIKAMSIDPGDKERLSNTLETIHSRCYLLHFGYFYYTF